MTTVTEAKRVRVGMTFHEVYADSNAEWEVIGKYDTRTWIVRIVRNPDYDGVQDVKTSRQILDRVNYDRRLQGCFQQSEDWFDNLKVGSILHYCNGFKTFVRCEVVIATDDNLSDRNGSTRHPEYLGKPVLQPIAMVGDWKESDLPRISPYTGEPAWCYYGDAIRDGRGAWRPSETCVYESPSVSSNYNQGPDPRALEPCDLTPRPLTVDELRDLPAHQALEKIRDLVTSSRGVPPHDVLAEVAAVLKRE